MKTHKIKLSTSVALEVFVSALNGWGVDTSTYEVDQEALTVTTKNANAVDVCTEEINRSRYTISVEKARGKVTT